MSVLDVAQMRFAELLQEITDKAEELEGLSPHISSFGDYSISTHLSAQLGAMLAASRNVDVREAARTTLTLPITLIIPLRRS